MILALALAGCGNDTGFGDAVDPTITAPSGVATMELSAASFTWDALVVGYSNSQDLTITSVGDGDLEIDEIKIVTDPDDAFFFDEIEDVVLQPTQTVTYAVVADMDVGWPLDAFAQGQLRIRTNDSACITAMLPLLAYPEGYTGEPVQTTDTSAANPCD